MKTAKRMIGSPRRRPFTAIISYEGSVDSVHSFSMSSVHNLSSVPIRILTLWLQLVCLMLNWVSKNKDSA